MVMVRTGATTMDTATAPTIKPFDIDFEAATERIRELNEKVLAAAKHTGNISLDTYEQTVNSLLDFSQKAADSTKVDWFSALAKSQASVITEVTNAYTKAARKLRKNPRQTCPAFPGVLDAPPPRNPAGGRVFVCAPHM